MENNFGIKEAKQKFTQILNTISSTHETVILTRNKKAIAKIIPFEEPERIIGLLQDKKYVIAKDFDKRDMQVEKMFLG